VIAAVEARSDDAREQAELLITEVTARTEAHPGELLLLAGADHSDVAAAVERVTQRRIDYLARTLRGTGLTAAVAARRATVGYAACLGHAQLARAASGVLPATPRGRRAITAEVVDALLRRP
jgi:hypothetical protein